MRRCSACCVLRIRQSQSLAEEHTSFASFAPYTIVPRIAMFHFMRNSNDYGTLDLVDRFMKALRSVIPSGTLNRLELQNSTNVEPDAVIRWDVGDETFTLAVEVKLSPLRTAPPLRNTLAGDAIPIVVAPYISKSACRALEDSGWSYWDATGNTLIRSRSPLLVVRLDGAEKDPNPEPTTSAGLRSLKGRAASEVIVGLLQNGGQTGSIRDFARERQLPLATVSRVVSLLRDENYIEPTGGGPIVLTDRIDVARRWADDYSFARSFRARRYYSLGGPEFALSKIAESGIRYAVTGVGAAQNWLSQDSKMSRLPSAETWVYVEDLTAVERIADLAPDPREGQILVAECGFLGREHVRQDGALNYATPWRLVGDLLSARGRIASVGEQLAIDLVRRWQ